MTGLIRMGALAVVVSLATAACTTTEETEPGSPSRPGAVSFVNLEPGDRVRHIFNGGTRLTPVINTDQCAARLCLDRAAVIERSATVMRTEFVKADGERQVATYTPDGRFQVNFFGGGREDVVDRGRFRIVR